MDVIHDLEHSIQETRGISAMLQGLIHSILRTKQESEN